MYPQDSFLSCLFQYFAIWYSLDQWFPILLACDPKERFEIISLGPKLEKRADIQLRGMYIEKEEYTDGTALWKWAMSYFIL